MLESRWTRILFPTLLRLIFCLEKLAHEQISHSLLHHLLPPLLSLSLPPSLSLFFRCMVGVELPPLSSVTLQHGDRLILGNSHFFRVNIPVQAASRR
jgi:hypothetical protein